MKTFLRVLPLVVLALSGCFGGGHMGLDGVVHRVLFDGPYDARAVESALRAAGWTLESSTDAGVVTTERDGVRVETSPGRDAWVLRARMAASFETREYAELQRVANETAAAQRPAFDAILAEFEAALGAAHRPGSYETSALTWVE